MNLWLIPFFPLLGFLLNGLFGKRLPRAAINAIGVGSVALSFVYVVFVLSKLYPLHPAYSEHYFTWIQSGFLHIGFDLFVDRLTAVMLLVVTGIGLLIHIYAVGYMAHEGGYYRFFSYFNLFVFFMLILVLASNLLVMFVGWEGVGLCSYLLIGFYFLEGFAGNAANKAFIVNRIGDFGFSLGIFLTVLVFKTLDFGKLATAVSGMPVEASAGALTAITLLLFVGAIGKSAQFPLYVWLPDAMAGPTPVSALIHAATMVTAGVYMVTRVSFLYNHAPLAMSIVAFIGLFTAVLAATIGITQNDIKRVFAYSTVSQLGYMFLGLGVGAYSAGIFHLMTHAFFKALLFLGAGSVIHGLSGEQDLRHMGGLWKRMPVTFITLGVASLAISGFPGFSGFFSKDAILSAAYAHTPWMFWVGSITAGMTAFYVFRAYFLAFFGSYRGHHHAHESPPVMTIPLIVLAAFSLLGGLINVPHWLSPAFPLAEHENVTAMAISVTCGILGIALAAYLYVIRPALAESLKTSAGSLYTLVANKYYVDELYSGLIVRPLETISRSVLWRGVDEALIDNSFVDGLFGRTIRNWGALLRHLQSGSVRNYATWVLAGALLMIFIFSFSGGGR
ncbi:MAG: NADH-quinone oxidoreductase subunit L [Acidobacteriaceae bacterium]|nr:NADH-quinone oxidoreductase subunit L [Acidobacteriaceae bacterium]MBV9779621.1 NADH-quinone oxidoreductase subunit L [Acidobacteriaceae bacterium]